MYATTKTTTVPLLIAALVLAGCDMTADPVASTTLDVRGDSGRSQDAVRLYEELSDRLAERGVTPRELQSALDAGDGPALRRMFGYTQREIDALYARLAAIGGGADRGSGGSGTGTPPPPDFEQPPVHERFFGCKAELAGCMLAAAVTALQGTGIYALAIYAVGSLGCAWYLCEIRPEEP
jgi:hypothetical protein